MTVNQLPQIPLDGTFETHLECRKLDKDASINLLRRGGGMLLYEQY